MKLHPGSAARSLERDDALGRKTFVENLVQCIRTYDQSDSLTIALYGPWGCGKSSLLNFVIEALGGEVVAKHAPNRSLASRFLALFSFRDNNRKKSNEGAPAARLIEVQRFNPWNFSHQDRLVSTFFATMSSLIKRADKSREVQHAAELLDTLAALTAPAALLGAGFVSESAKRLSDVAKDAAHELADIERAKSEISDVLARSSKRYVVVIDDIDRLTETEIRQIFQLVKSMADFRNVIYLLAFDRVIVAKALDGVTGGEGNSYLEKIVNVLVSVPQISQRQIHRLLVGELKAYSGRQRQYNWDNKRLENVMQVAVRNFTTIRQIERLANALTVVEELTKEDIDFTDQIALTILKVLEPNVFDFIAKHPELFVDDIANQFSRSKDQDGLEKKLIDKALALLQSIGPDDAAELLQIVFPKIGRLYGHGSKSWGNREWRREHRACADYKTFSRYFVMRVDEGDISAADRDRLRASLGSIEAFEEFLRNIGDPERLQRTMEYLGDLEPGEISEGAVAVVVSAVIDVGDEFQHLDDVFAEIFLGPFKEAIDACNALLRGVQDSAHRLALVLEALHRPARSLEMPIVFLDRVGSQKVGTFSPDEAAEITTAVVALLRGAWESDSVLEHRRALFVVTQWLRLDPTGARQAIRDRLSSNDGELLRFLRLYENIQTSRSFAPERFSHESLGGVYTLEELQQRLRRISNDPDYNQEHQRINEILGEVERGMEREAERRARTEQPAVEPSTPALPRDGINLEY